MTSSLRGGQMETVRKNTRSKTMLHKQRSSSTRQNIPFETFEVTIYATLDTRRKNGVQFSSKNRNSWYRVYKNFAWSNANQGDFVTVEIETDKEPKKIDPYCCAIMVDILPRLKKIGHVSREISRHIFFLKEENGKVDGVFIQPNINRLQFLQEG